MHLYASLRIVPSSPISFRDFLPRFFSEDFFVPFGDRFFSLLDSNTVWPLPSARILQIFGGDVAWREMFSRINHRIIHRCPTELWIMVQHSSSSNQQQRPAAARNGSTASTTRCPTVRLCIMLIQIVALVTATIFVGIPTTILRRYNNTTYSTTVWHTRVGTSTVNGRARFDYKGN